MTCHSLGLVGGGDEYPVCTGKTGFLRHLQPQAQTSNYIASQTLKYTKKSCIYPSRVSGGGYHRPTKGTKCTYEFFLLRK